MANMSSHYVNVDSFRPAKLHDGSMRHQLDMGVFLLPMALATALSYYAVRILLFLSAFKAQGHDKAPKAPRIPRTVVTFGGILVTFLRTPLAFLLSARYWLFKQTLQSNSTHILLGISRITHIRSDSGFSSRTSTLTKAPPT